ncbi:unnamed protein product [Calicophoron daubneyi]|uniref:Uncharacterized protein n=1 Tax=Calicophoron daubneyi TaxID=300641 RepID=A0AAV2T309_CALDB
MEDCVYRHAVYIGSFSVEETDNHLRAQKVQQNLESLRVFERSKDVLICISVRGIKISSVDREMIYMAHALRRVSYATCDAPYKQFAFLAREPMGEANHQYCHVFVAPDSSQAEELNRIVGDAFQLAYLRQRLKAQGSSSEGSDVSSTSIPRLTDRHPPWPPPPASDDPSSSALNVLNLPPPPSCPPPPLEGETIKSEEPRVKEVSAPVPLPPDSPPVVNNVASRDQTTPATSTSNSSSSTASECALSGSKEPETRAAQTTPPTQSTDLVFLRRHFLRRSEGKRTPDPQILGGSTRQPRRRQGNSLASLFSAARHSAFFPSSTVKEPEPSQLSDPSDLGDASSSETPLRVSHIFFDLRTFSGGSPVVALKERLDAQAIAEAKASACAEAAAVLAAAKLASERAAHAPAPPATPPRSTESVRPEIYPIVNSSPSSTDSRGSGVFRMAGEENSDPAPPPPPVRVHSLRHSHDDLTFGAAQSSSKLDERVYDEAETSEDNVHGTVPFRTLSHFPSSNIHSTGVEQSRRNSEFIMSTSSALNGHAELVLNRLNSNGPQSRSAFVQNQKSTDPNFSMVASPSRPTDKSDRKPHFGSRRVVRPKPHHRERPKYPDDQSSVVFSSSCERPVATKIGDNTSYTRSPLHVIADQSPSTVISHAVDQPWTTSASGGGWSQQQQSIMSASSISAETPTPTATPTPTPTQTPQPTTAISNHSNSTNGSVNIISDSQEEAEFLQRAPWYRAFLPREVAFELLAREEVGSFLVRNSTTHPDCCALSVRVPLEENPIGITHYLIQRTKHGMRLKGLDKEWPSLRALITHLTVIPEMLPCPLRLPLYTNNPMFTHVDEQPIERDQRSHRGTAVIPFRPNNEDSVDGHHIICPETMQPVTSLPSRPVPPSCASRAYLSSLSHPIPQRIRKNSPDSTTHGRVGLAVPSDLAATSVGSNTLNVVHVQSYSICDTHAPSNHTPSNSQGITNLEERRYKGNNSHPVDGVPDSVILQSNQNANFLMLDTDDQEDEDYQRLSDFSSIMAELKLVPDTPLTSC